MTGRAIDHRACAFQVLDVFQEVVVDRAHHLGHIASRLLRGLIILFPLVNNMAMSTVNAERAAVAQPHYVEQATGRYTFEKLNVFENCFRRFILPTRDLLSQLSKFCLLIESLGRRSSL